jgi:hypothetical protein
MNATPAAPPLHQIADVLASVAPGRERPRPRSPHTLELAKTRALFTDEQATRDRWRAELAWLAAAAAPVRKRARRPTA